MSYEQHHRHVLIVEDNEPHAELTARIWRRKYPGVICHHVSDGADAVDFLEQRGQFAQSPCPSLVLLDLRIPKIDGLEVLDEIKASGHLRRIPVVVVTSSTSPNDIRNAYQHYANAYLTKPADYEEFCQLIGAIGDFWLKQNCCCPIEDRATMLGV